MSKKRDKEISLSEKLSSLIQTKPSAIESDDDDLITVEKIAFNENDSENSADELEVSKFRRINERLLEEDDVKYSGKGISRKDLYSSTDINLIGRDLESNEIPYTSADSSTSYHGTEEDVEENGSEAEIRSDIQSDNIANKKLKLNESKFECKNFNNEIFLKAASDIEKGKAIRNQLHIWDFLLECRLKFQKCLIASNQFPNYKDFLKFKSKGDPSFHDSTLQCKKSIQHLLHSLLTLQDVLLKSNDDFLNSNTIKKKEVKIYNDEEISSDSEKSGSFENISIPPTKKLKTLNDFSEVIYKRHVNFQSYRDTTIQKWNDKTRIGYISNKNFSAFEQSTLKQIEHVLLDKQRLIKRTQTKRSDYRILGEHMEPPLKKSTSQSDGLLIIPVDIKSKNLHKEIFDDDDFYHQLLSEMVKRKASDVTDPVQLGKQWIQLQKIRSKMKKTVDTKASKGRKIRFVVHPKLVNFMMPINSFNYNEESKTELFNSLFGKSKK